MEINKIILAAKILTYLVHCLKHTFEHVCYIEFLRHEVTPLNGWLDGGIFKHIIVAYD